MSGETSLIMIIIGAALINNVVLSQFLGICSFLGVSSQIKSSRLHRRWRIFCTLLF